MTEERRRWIEAAKVLADDAQAFVACPACAGDHLLVIDVPIPSRDALERHMTCPRCKATNGMVMRVR